MKPKQTKENIVKESDPVSKGNQKWYQSINNKVKTENRKQDQSTLANEE